MATGQLLTTLKKVSDKRVSRSRGSRDSGPDRHAEELIQKAINRLHKVDKENCSFELFDSVMMVPETATKVELPALAQMIKSTVDPATGGPRGMLSLENSMPKGE